MLEWMYLLLISVDTYTHLLVIFLVLRMYSITQKQLTHKIESNSIQMCLRFSFPAQMPLPAPSKISIHCYGITYSNVSDCRTFTTMEAYNEIVNVIFSALAMYTDTLL